VIGDGTWIRHSGYNQLLDMGNWTDGLVRIESTGAPMYIRAAGSNYIALDTNSVERCRIDSSGLLQIGTTGKTGRLNLQPNPSNNHFVEFYNTSDVKVGEINVSSGTTTNYVTSSDGRLKDVTGSARGLEVINELNPVSYNWKSSGHADEGLIAQEVLDIVPNAVSGSEEEMYSMDYSKLVVHLVKAVKELSTEVDELKKQLEK